MMKRIGWRLQHAKAVTAATDRLKTGPGEDVPAVRDKITVVKNGCAQSAPPECRKDTKQLVWTSSDVPFFLRENPQFAAGLASLLDRHGYEAILIGRFDDDLRKSFARARHIGHLDFASYRQYLRTLAGAICRHGCRRRRSAISMRNRT